MATIHPWLWRAAKFIASNPRLRANALEVFNREVKPRAEDTWRRTRPKLEVARADLREIARETNPRENPGKFASRVKERFLDRKNRR
ncbi:MAG: hypothetical protein ACE5LF_01025 [Alphaproteobacteria bacterium]